MTVELLSMLHTLVQQVKWRATVTFAPVHFGTRKIAQGVLFILSPTVVLYYLLRVDEAAQE